MGACLQDGTSCSRNPFFCLLMRWAMNPMILGTVFILLNINPKTYQNSNGQMNFDVTLSEIWCHHMPSSTQERDNAWELAVTRLTPPMLPHRATESACSGCSAVTLGHAPRAASWSVSKRGAWNGLGKWNGDVDDSVVVIDVFKLI